MIAVNSASQVGSAIDAQAAVTPDRRDHVALARRPRRRSSGLLKYLVNGPASSRLRAKRAIVSAGSAQPAGRSDPLVGVALVVVDDVTDRCPHGAVVAGAGAMPPTRSSAPSRRSRSCTRSRSSSWVDGGAVSPFDDGGATRSVIARRPFVDVAPAGPLALTHGRVGGDGGGQRFQRPGERARSGQGVRPIRRPRRAGRTAPTPRRRCGRRTASAADRRPRSTSTAGRAAC